MQRAHLACLSVDPVHAGNNRCDEKPGLVMALHSNMVASSRSQSKGPSPTKWEHQLSIPAGWKLQDGGLHDLMERKICTW